MIIYEYLPPAFGMPGKHSQKSSELAALVTKLARNSKPVAKNSLFIDRAAILGFSVCFVFFFYLVAVSRDFLEAAPFILIGFLKEIKSPSVNLYMRISYSIDYIKDFNFRLHIQTRAKLWPLLQTAPKIGVIKSKMLVIHIIFR